MPPDSAAEYGAGAAAANGAEERILLGIIHILNFNIDIENFSRVVKTESKCNLGRVKNGVISFF